MPDTKTPETQPSAPDRRRLSPSAVAAVVEAAYILDAIRR